jgi:hypothetical protein
MITFSSNPINWTYSRPFDCKVNQKRSIYKELFYSGEAIEVVSVVFDTLKAKARFTEIKNSTIKQIDILGNVYLHDCSDEIESVHASGNIYLYNCAKVNYIISEKDIFIVRRPQELETCEYGSFKAKNIYTMIIPTESERSDTYRLEDANLSKTLILGEFIKIIELHGDNRVAQIIFNNKKYLPSECKVIVKNGATFCGEVLGGELVFET